MGAGEELAGRAVEPFQAPQAPCLHSPCQKGDPGHLAPDTAGTWYWEALGGLPTDACGIAGGRVWDTWAHHTFNPSRQHPLGCPDNLPCPYPLLLLPFLWKPCFSSPAQIPSLGSLANGAGNLDPLPPSLALLIGSGAFPTGKAVIRGWIPTDREQPPHPPTPSPF